MTDRNDGVYSTVVCVVEMTENIRPRDTTHDYVMKTLKRLKLMSAETVAEGNFLYTIRMLYTCLCISLCLHLFQFHWAILTLWILMLRYHFVFLISCIIVHVLISNLYGCYTRQCESVQSITVTYG